MSHSTAVPRKAGRELDALIAERVMGWRLFESVGETWATKRRPGLNHSNYTAEVQDVGDRLMFAGRHFGFFAPGWAPSTNVAAAWEVIEHLNRERWFVEVYNDPDGKWYATVGAFPTVEHIETAPLAICLAALAAVGAGALPQPGEKKP